MKIFKILLYQILSVGALSPIFGQSNYSGQFSDAVNFSSTNIAGSSRILGLGGAGSTVGADVSSGFLNPAGLGFYRKSEFSGTIGFNSNGSKTNYLGENLNDNRQTINLPSFGIVFNNSKDDVEEGSYRGGSFSISFTRMNNFQNQFSYSGLNRSNSLTDFFAEAAEAGGYDSASFGSSREIRGIVPLAYHGYLFEGTKTNGYSSLFVNGGSSAFPIRQEASVLTRGAQNQWDFAYGGNIGDVLYLGGGVGIPTVRYIVENVYTERGTNYVPSISNFTWTDYLKVSGLGINAKIGVIVKPADFIRFGGMIQSPTYYSLNSVESHSVSTTFSDGSSEDLDMVPRDFKYNLTAPMRLKGGMTVLFGKLGFITADAEYVAYNNARFSADSYQKASSNFTNDNKQIKSQLRNTFNLNVGSELRFNLYRVRVGAGYYKDPYGSNSGLSTSKGLGRDMLVVSAGGGIRLDDYYFDVALVNSFSKRYYAPYSLYGYEPVATVKSSNTNLTFTLGAFF